MSTHNICFYKEIWKIIPKLSPNTLLICSTVTMDSKNRSDFIDEHAYQCLLYTHLLVGFAEPKLK